MAHSLEGRNDPGLELGGTSHPAAGRVVVPRLIRDPTPLDLLKTTLRTYTSSLLPLSPLTSPASPPPQAKATRQSPHSALQSPKFGVGKTHTPLKLESESGENQGLGFESAFDLSSAHDLTSRGRDGEDQIVWSRWDVLNEELEGVGLKRILILAYATGIALWDCTSLDHFSETLNIQSIDVLLSQSTVLSSQFPLGIGSILDASNLPSPVVSHEDQTDIYQSSRPLLAILTHRENTSFSHVLLYSLTSHSFLEQTIEIAGTVHSLKANKRFLVISSSSPIALNILSSTTFLPISSSPLTDVAPNPFDGSPVFDLGQGGRILTYATTTPIPSRDGRNALPGVGIIASPGMFESDDQSLRSFEGTSHGFLEEAGHVGGEVARRVGEGVLSGVKAIGGLGMNYWNTRHGGEREETGTTRSEARSAPLPTILGFEKKFSAGGGAGLAPGCKSNNGPSTSRDRYLDSSTSGSVIVVDLLSSVVPSLTKSRSSTIHSLKILAHFRCSSPLALLSFSPSSSLLLTSSSQAHSFDIFELKPAVSVGLSATTNGGGLKEGPGGGKVWHRYRLNRGFTSAKAGRAEWSRDSRFVGVCTGRGTTHIYATQPFGGPPDLSNHFGSKVANAERLQPLSVVLSTISRVRHMSTSEEESHFSTRPSTLVPSIQFLPKLDSITSCMKPEPVHRQFDSSPQVPPHLFPPDPISFQDILLFYPQTATCALNRLSSLPAPKTTSEAASRGDVGRLATTAVSNLSTLMNNKGMMVDKSKKLKEKGGEWVVESVRKAEWAVGRTDGGVRVAELGERRKGKKRKGAGFERYGAQVEIETFSRSTHVLPRSIYQSQQFDFFSLPSNFALLVAAGSSSAPLRRLEVRSTVQIRQGGASSTDSLSQQTDVLQRSPSSESAFDQPILSAMQTILDHNGVSSTSSLAPTFPNGVAGRRGRWRDTIHISNVGPTVNEGLGRVRRELGRVGSIVPKRRASAGTTYSSSISFEDEDAVWANDLGDEEGETFHHSESGSTACTSEPEGGSDDTSWGLEGFDDEETGRKDIPFEEDDDFFLELSGDKPSTKPVVSTFKPETGSIKTYYAEQDSSSSSGIDRSSPEGGPTQLRVPVEASRVAPVIKKKTRKVVKQISRPTTPLSSVD